MVYIYLSALIIGLIHGIEPGHGWPVAVYYSIHKEKKILYGIITSSILAFFHFFSSIAVVVAFLLFNKAVNFTSFAIARHLAFGMLLILAIKAWYEKPHEIKRKKTKTLWQMASYAFALGFIHEEEFAILAFCVGGNNCLALMITYAIAVSIALIAITLLSIKSYGIIQQRIKKYEKHLPKIFAAILFVIAISYLFRF